MSETSPAFQTKANNILPNNPSVSSNQTNTPPFPTPQPQPFPQEVASQPQPEPFKDGEVNPEAGQYFATQAKAAANVPTESRTFTITWPAELGATWMTAKNLETVIKNTCPNTQFKITE